MAFLDNKEIGNRLKEKRKPTNLSARKFAIGAGVDQSQYAKIEKGELPITENIMDKLVKAYNLDKDSILYGTDVPRGTNNHSTTLNKAQGSHNSKNLGLDLIKEVGRLDDDNLRIMATLKVIIYELAPLISKATGRSHSSVSLQLEKDISEKIESLKTLRDKKLSGG